MPRANGWPKGLFKQIDSSSAARSIQLNQYLWEDLTKAQEYVWELLERIKGIGQYCNHLEDRRDCHKGIVSA